MTTSLLLSFVPSFVLLHKFGSHCHTHLSFLQQLINVAFTFKPSRDKSTSSAGSALKPCKLKQELNTMIYAGDHTDLRPAHVVVPFLFLEGVRKDTCRFEDWIPLLYLSIHLALYFLTFLITLSPLLEDALPPARSSTLPHSYSSIALNSSVLLMPVRPRGCRRKLALEAREPLSDGPTEPARGGRWEPDWGSLCGGARSGSRPPNWLGPRKGSRAGPREKSRPGPREGSRYGP